MTARMDPDELEATIGRITSSGATALRALADLVEKSVEIRKQYHDASPEEVVRILGEWTGDIGPVVLEELAERGDHEASQAIGQNLAEYCLDPSRYFEELSKLALHCIRLARSDEKFFRQVAREAILAKQTHELICYMAEESGGTIIEHRPRTDN